MSAGDGCYHVQQVLCAGMQLLTAGQPRVYVCAHVYRFVIADYAFGCPCSLLATIELVFSVQCLLLCVAAFDHTWHFLLAWQGRGYSLPAEIALVDARWGLEGPVVSLPMRDVMHKEAALFCR